MVVFHHWLSFLYRSPPTSQKNTVLNVHSKPLPSPDSHSLPTAWGHTKQYKICREISHVQTGADKSPNKVERAKYKLLRFTTSDNKILSVNTPGLQSNTALALYLRKQKTNKKTHHKTAHTKNQPKQPIPNKYLTQSASGNTDEGYYSKTPWFLDKDHKNQVSGCFYSR